MRDGRVNEQNLGARLKALLVAGVATVAISLALVPQAKAFDQCEGYASTSVEQQAMNVVQGCDYKGFRWHSWYDGHYQWCKGVSVRRISREIRRRDGELDRCHDDF